MAGPGFVNFRLRRHLAARRAPRRRRRRRRRLRPARPRRTASGSTSSSSRPTPPARSTPATAAGPPTATRWRACSSRCGYGPHTRVLPQRPRRPDGALRRRRSAAQARASRCRRTATAASTSIDWAAEMPDDADPARVGLRAGARRPPRDARAAWASHFDTLVQRARPRRHRARSRPRSPTCAPRGVVYEADGAMWLRSTDFGDDKDRVLVRSRRRAHLPAARHRLPPRQVRPRLRPADRRVGRRPPRLRGPACRPPCRRSATTRPTLEVIIGQLVSSCATARRCGSPSGPATSSSCDDVIDEVGPDAARLTYLLQSIDTRQTFDLDVVAAAGDGEPGLLRADTPTPASTRIGRVAAERGVDAATARRASTSRCSPTSASSTCCGSWPSCPTWSSWPPRRAGPPQGHHLGAASWPARFHGFYHDCWVMGEGVAARADPGPAVAGRGGPGRPAAIGLDLLGVSAPDLDVTRSHCAATVPGEVALSRSAACCPTPPTVGADGRLRSAASTPSTWPREFGTPLFVYDEAHLRARCREAVAAFRRRRRLRDQGVPLRGHGPPRPRGGHGPRRRHRRRAARRARPPACPPTGWSSTATTSRSTSCGRALDGRRRPHRRRQLRRDRPAGRASCADGLPVPEVLCGSRPGVEAHTHEYVATGQADSKFGFGLPSGAGRGRRRPAPAPTRPPSSWSASTSTSAARSSRPTPSPGRSSVMAAVRPAPAACPSCRIGGGLGVAYVEGEAAPTHHRVGRRVLHKAVRGRRHRAASSRRARPGHRGGGRRHPLHGRHDQGHARRPHLRRRRRRHERQPPAGALRQRLRDVPAPGGRPPTGPAPVRVVGKHCESGDVLVRDGPGARRPRRRRHPGHAGHRRLRARHGLATTTGAPPGRGVRGRRRGPPGRAARDHDDLLRTRCPWLGRSLRRGADGWIAEPR